MLPPGETKARAAAVKWRKSGNLSTAGGRRSKAYGGKVGRVRKLATAGGNKSKGCGGKMEEEWEACYCRER